MSKGHSQNYYQYFKGKLLSNKWIALIVLAATVVLAVVNFYDEVSNMYGTLFPNRVNVVFSLSYSALSSDDTVVLEQDNNVKAVSNFNPDSGTAMLETEEGIYQVYVEIDGQRISCGTRELKRDQTTGPMSLELEFSVEGQVRNGTGDALPDFRVAILRQTYTTRDDGRFLLDNLPMQKSYDIVAYSTMSDHPITRNDPYRGTVLNVSWANPVNYNIEISEIR